MKYTSIQIPNILIIFVMGISGFLGAMSFFGIVFNNMIIGFIAGCCAFVIMFISCCYMSKSINEQKEKQLELKNENCE